MPPLLIVVAIATAPAALRLCSPPLRIVVALAMPEKTS
jgi:hypothetical protein